MTASHKVDISIRYQPNTQLQPLYCGISLIKVIGYVFASLDNHGRHFLVEGLNNNCDSKLASYLVPAIFFFPFDRLIKATTTINRRQHLNPFVSSRKDLL